MHVLKDTTLSQEHVILNYVLGPRDLNGHAPRSTLSLRELAPEAVMDLLGPLTRMVGEAGARLAVRHAALARQVVAHFSPATFWRREQPELAEDCSHQTWTLLDGLLKASYWLLIRWKSVMRIRDRVPF